MELEAVKGRFSQIVHGSVRRLQIVSIAGWFDGERPDLPPRGDLSYDAFARTPFGGRRRIIDPNEPELPLSFLGDRESGSVVRYLNPQTVRGAAG